MSCTGDPSTTHGLGSCQKRFSLFGAGAMAPRAPREPARHRARRPTPPALRGAPGAKGDRSRIRWTPPGAPDGRNPSIPAELCSHSCTTPTCSLPAHNLRIARGRCDAPRRLTVASLMMLLAGVHEHSLRNHQPARDARQTTRTNLIQPASLSASLFATLAAGLAESLAAPLAAPLAATLAAAADRPTDRRPPYRPAEPPRCRTRLQSTWQPTRLRQPLYGPPRRPPTDPEATHCQPPRAARSNDRFADRPVDRPAGRPV